MWLENKYFSGLEGIQIFIIAIREEQTVVLGLSGIELIFFVVAGTVL